MNVRKLSTCLKLAALAVVVTFSAVGASSAAACDPPCQYKQVVTYVSQQQPYQACVVKYDHCGKPYHAYVTQYRTVHVPVTKWVKVCY